METDNIPTRHCKERFYSAAVSLYEYNSAGFPVHCNVLNPSDYYPSDSFRFFYSISIRLYNQHFFLRAKKTACYSCLLREGISSLGCSKNYIMYWGVVTFCIITHVRQKVCTNLTKFYLFFY